MSLTGCRRPSERTGHATTPAMSRNDVMGSVTTGVMATPVERVHGRARGGGWNIQVPGLPGKSHGATPSGAVTT